MPHPLYAIGDIHGYADELDRVLTLIEADGGPKARIVPPGAYGDRGPPGGRGGARGGGAPAANVGTGPAWSRSTRTG